MRPPIRQGSSDDFQTPPVALLPILPYINPKWTIWECASGEGWLVEYLEKEKFNVIGTDIIYDDAELCKDFLLEEPAEWDCIITNPPFSKKQEFLQRCYELKKPFALLLPLTTLETAKRQKLFKDNGVEIIFFDKRINFGTPSGKGSGSWFATAWFTHGLGIGREMTFVKLEKTLL